MSGVTVRPERAISGRLSVPVAATQAVALSWKGSGITSLEELDRTGKKISVNAGGHLEKVTQQFFRRADVMPIADNAAVRMALLDRTADGVVTDNFEEKVWMAGAPDAVHLGSLSNDRKAYLLPADRAELAAELDRWLLAREKDGTLAELRKRYFRNVDGSEVTSGDETLHTAAPVEALAAVVRERVGLMPFVYEAKKRDGKPIEDKVQEAAVLDGAARAVAAEAAAVSVPAPDEQAVRSLVETLIEIGKDVQQRAADSDGRQRPGAIVHRSGAPEPETEEDAASGKVVRTTGPDLAKDLRPALARIGEKIARIVVAMDEPVSARSARATLAASLESQGVKSERLDALADAVARLSARRK
jgi:chorismate mutase